MDEVCGRVLDEFANAGSARSDAGDLHHGTTATFTASMAWRTSGTPTRSRSACADRARPAAAAGAGGTTNVDLGVERRPGPTILAAAGVQAPSGMQGRDFAPLYLAVPPPKWREEFFYEHATIDNTRPQPRLRGVVRKDWKYLWWPDFKYEELFDLRNDLAEEHNLAADAKSGERVMELRRRFAELRRWRSRSLLRRCLKAAHRVTLIVAHVQTPFAVA